MFSHHTFVFKDHTLIVPFPWGTRQIAKDNLQDTRGKITKGEIWLQLGKGFSEYYFFYEPVKNNCNIVEIDVGKL